MLPLIRAALLACLAAPLAACGGMPSMGSLFASDETPKQVLPPDQLFSKADKELEKGNYSKAAEVFEEVDKDHPYAQEARRAIVMSAVAYQQAGKHSEAVAAARRYLTLHPGTKEAALAQNVIANSYFARLNDPQRDQSDTRQAVVELETLVRRYPDSRYAADAQKRIKIAKDTLAAAEMNVGRYYQKQGNQLGAINRFKVVIGEYQQTAHVEEALARLTECYYALGITAEAQTAAAILGHNFPDSQWYKDSYALLKSNGVEPREDTGSWISRAFKGAVKTVAG